MKSVKYWGSASLVVIAVAVVAFIALPALAQDSGTDSARYPVDTITVSGSGSAAGAPNIATMEIGVETRNVDVREAFSQNNTTIDSVIAALLEAGVAREDIRTSGLSIYQDRYGYGMGIPESEMTSTFVVNNLVRVVVRDTAKVGDVMSAAVDAGANNIYGLNFGIEDQTALESDARVQAMANAAVRAEELAKIAGVELGEILVINENWGGGVGPFDVMNLATAGLGGGGASIEPGQLSVTVQVQVTYRINR